MIDPRLIRTPAFFELVMQALTLGKAKVTTSAFPTFAGYLTYAAAIGLLGTILLVADSNRALIASIVLLAFLAVVALMMLLWKHLHPAVLNLLAILIVFCFIGMISTVTWVLANDLVGTGTGLERNMVWVVGNVYDAEGRPVNDAVVSIPGRRESASTDANGHFSFQVQRDLVLKGDSVSLVVIANGEVLHATARTGHSANKLRFPTLLVPPGAPGKGGVTQMPPPVPPNSQEGEVGQTSQVPRD